jgi:hypothetical protein
MHLRKNNIQEHSVVTEGKQLMRFTKTGSMWHRNNCNQSSDESLLNFRNAEAFRSDANRATVLEYEAKIVDEFGLTRVSITGKNYR